MTRPLVGVVAPASYRTTMDTRGTRSVPLTSPSAVSFRHGTRDVSVVIKCDMIFRLFLFGNYHYHKFELINFAR